VLTVKLECVMTQLTHKGIGQTCFFICIFQRQHT